MVKHLVKCRTSQFMFPKYLIEYRDVKIVKSKFRCEKSKKNKYKSNVVLNEKKIKIDMMSVA